MGMGFAPTWLCQGQVSPPPPLHMTTLTTAHVNSILSDLKELAEAWRAVGDHNVANTYST